MSFPPNPPPGGATTITVSPASSILTWEQSTQLVAALTDAYGTTVEPTKSFIWASTNPSLATVSNTGLVTVSSSPADLAPGGLVTISCVYPFASGGTGAGTIHASATV